MRTDFPDGPVAKNPPCNAADSGSIPGQGIKIPHAEQKLSPWATTRESMCRSEKSHMMQGRSQALQLKPNTAK